MIHIVSVEVAVEADSFADAVNAVKYKCDAIRTDIGSLPYNAKWVVPFWRVTKAYTVEDA